MVEGPRSLHQEARDARSEDAAATQSEERRSTFTCSVTESVEEAEAAVSLDHAEQDTAAQGGGSRSVEKEATKADRLERMRASVRKVESTFTAPPPPDSSDTGSSSGLPPLPRITLDQVRSVRLVRFTMRCYAMRLRDDGWIA
eukprot:SAG25_NODE_124_length_14606_cov_739.419177_10_plen_143_part_00